MILNDIDRFVHFTWKGTLGKTHLSTVDTLGLVILDRTSVEWNKSTFFKHGDGCPPCPWTIVVNKQSASWEHLATNFAGGLVAALGQWTWIVGSLTIATSLAVCNLSTTITIITTITSWEATNSASIYTMAWGEWVQSNWRSLANNLRSTSGSRKCLQCHALSFPNLAWYLCNVIRLHEATASKNINSPNSQVP